LVEANKITEGQLKTSMEENDPLYDEKVREMFPELGKTGVATNKQRLAARLQLQHELNQANFIDLLNAKSVTNRQPGTTAFEAASRIRKIAN